MKNQGLLDRLRKMALGSDSVEMARLADYDARVASGRLLPFEYPVIPQVRKWKDTKGGIGKLLEDNEGVYKQNIATILNYAETFSTISMNGDPDELEPYWDNEWFPPLDAIHLYSLIASKKPRIYMEVGSGNSTKFARKAVTDHSPTTRIVSIDPSPRAKIDEICDEIIRAPLESVPVETFDVLGPDDVLFIDNSHIGFQGSDVTVFFTEVLPRLAPGVIWGIHDIFLPNDYPAEWTKRYYNEQYYLMTYLLGGAQRDRIQFPAAYIASRDMLVGLRNAISERTVEPLRDDWLDGGAFWMQRIS